MARNGTTQERYRRPKDRFVTDLTDGEWAAIEPLIPPPGRTGRRRGPDMREVFNAVLFIPGTGCRTLCSPSPANLRTARRSRRLPRSAAGR